MHDFSENISYQNKSEEMGTNDEAINENGSKYLIFLLIFSGN